MPPNITEDMLDYLDDVRESGLVNMWGTTSTLQSEFPELTKREAREILIQWMTTFGSRYPTEERTE